MNYKFNALVCAVTSLGLFSCAGMNSKYTERTPNQAAHVEGWETSQKKSAAVYRKFETAINSARNKAEAADKTKDSVKIANAYKALATTQAESRKAGHICDIAYLGDLAGAFTKALNHSPWMQQNARSLEVYKLIGQESVQMQLATAGFIGLTKTFSPDQVAKIFNQVFSNPASFLYKATPGVMSLGRLDISSGQVKDVSNGFTEDGDFEQVVSQPASIKAVVGTNGFVQILIGNKPYYSVVFERDGKVIKSNILSTDSLNIRNVGSESESNYQNELHLAPDECSA